LSGQRRRDRRFPFRTEAEVRFSSWSAFRLLYTVNISRGGMTVGLSEAVEVGATLDVRLVLPGDRSFLLKAVVRHCGRAPGSDDDYRAGVQFIDLDEPQRAEIEHVLAVHAG
jgi:hypothetical protein